VIATLSAAVPSSDAAALRARSEISVPWAAPMFHGKLLVVTPSCPASRTARGSGT